MGSISSNEGVFMGKPLGSTVYQVNRLFECVKDYGNKKGANKRAFFKQAKIEGIKATTSAFAERSGIYSYQTGDTYRGIWRNCFDFAKKEFGVKDIKKVTGEMAQAFVEHKIAAGINNATTIKNYRCALVKMAVALEKSSGNNSLIADYRSNIDKAVGSIKLVKPEKVRAYKDVSALVGALKSDTHRLAAALIRETGMRATEASLINPSQLKDDNTLHYKSKGGQDNEKPISNKLADKLRNSFEESGKFSFNQNAFRKDLKSAAEATGQKYFSIHGLRWSFAQEMAKACVFEKGMSLDEARLTVSRALSHHRPSITDHYLKK
jgi:integrase